MINADVLLQCNDLLNRYHTEFSTITTKLVTGPTALRDFYVLNVLCKGLYNNNLHQLSLNIINQDKKQIEYAIKYIKKML